MAQTMWNLFYQRSSLKDSRIIVLTTELKLLLFLYDKINLFLFENLCKRVILTIFDLT